MHVTRYGIYERALPAHNADLMRTYTFGALRNFWAVPYALSLQKINVCILSII